MNELSADWYQVFREITQYHFVALSELLNHKEFGERIKQRDHRPIATLAELKNAGIQFHPNPTKGAGIPQGTPISAAFSNLYMVDFDRKMQAYAAATGAFYRRYSDDILLICKPDYASEAEAKVKLLISEEGLSLNEKKTERTRFDLSRPTATQRPAQYLGFTLGAAGVGIRASSLSRQWRKMRRAIKRTRKIAEISIMSGKSNRAFTKRLFRRFTAVPVRNFPAYARRSATSFQEPSIIKKQLKKLERAAEREIRSLKTLNRIE